MSILGIDLGTTNSVVYTYEKGLFKAVDIAGRKVTPTVVSWNPDSGEFYAGHQAKKRVMINPETSIVSNKKHMGDRLHRYLVLDRSYSPVEIAGIFLNYLREETSKTLNTTVRKAVITVPAYFNQNQKEDTLLAAQQAGLEVLKLQAEPTAAAIAYALDRKKNQTILVYDLGGGTFDVSILKVQDNHFKVLAIGGNSDLGGDDFDNAILDYLYKKIQSEFGVDLYQTEEREAKIEKQKLKELAEQAKIELSTTSRTEIVLNTFMGRGPFECQLSRKQFERLIAPHIDRTIEIVRQTIQEAGLGKDDINRVICVGGSTKIPIVRQTIETEIKTPYLAKNVDEIVAEGAAITACNIEKPVTLKSDNNRPVEINDSNVTPFNLGIRLDRDDMGIIIPKNTSLPFSAEKAFTTQTDYAEETEIVVFQGNEKKCSNNVMLGGFTFKGIQRAQAGIPKIKVSFTLNESDILEIEARDESTNTTGKLVIEKFEAKPYEPIKDKKRSIEELRIGVSKVGYDDVGAILEKMNLPWREIKDSKFANLSHLKEFDVVFINCQSGGNASSNREALRQFVEDGGVLYASDCAKSHIQKAFPGKLQIKSNSGFSGDVKCSIEDSDFSRLLNKNQIKIHFNTVLYYAKKVKESQGTVFLSGAYSGGGKRPVVVGFPFGKGYVIFTAFHNYGSASRDEVELLKYVILKPISIVAKTSLVELAEQILKRG